MPRKADCGLVGRQVLPDVAADDPLLPLAGMRRVVLVGVVIAGCTAGGPRTALAPVPAPAASSGLAGERPPDVVEPISPPAGPPTRAECEASQPSTGDCHFTLMPTFYCGGPSPPPSMLWERCSCEACVTDEHCGRGKRCVPLASDEECAQLQNVCVDPTKACTKDEDCGTPERCQLFEGRPQCRVPTLYPPRP